MNFKSAGVRGCYSVGVIYYNMFRVLIRNLRVRFGLRYKHSINTLHISIFSQNGVVISIVCC